MSTRSVCAGLMVCAVVALLLLVAPAQGQQKPNVVFILADNVGYGARAPDSGPNLLSAHRCFRSGVALFFGVLEHLS
jgi:hypothetical protein